MAAKYFEQPLVEDRIEVWNGNLLHRRQFIGNISKAGILGGLAATPLAGIAEQLQPISAGTEEEHVFLTKPYLQAPGTGSICINWIANKVFIVGWSTKMVTIWIKKAHETTDGFITAYNRINCIELKNLKAATDYRYKIIIKRNCGFSTIYTNLWRNDQQ